MTLNKDYWSRAYPNEKKYEKDIAKDPIAAKQYARRMKAYKARKYVSGVGWGAVLGNAVSGLFSGSKKARVIGTTLGAASGIAGAQREIWRGHRWAHNKAMQRVHPGIATRKREKRMGIREREELIELIVEAYKTSAKTARRATSYKNKQYLRDMDAQAYADWLRTFGHGEKKARAFDPAFRGRKKPWH